MEVWIQDFLNSHDAGMALLAVVFLLGIVSVFTCACNFSVIAMLTAYSGTAASSEKKRNVLLTGMYFLAGMLISMSVLGAIIGLASEFMGNTMGTYWKMAAGLISLFFGLLTLDLLPFKFRLLETPKASQKQSKYTAALFGLTIGGLSLACSSCCNPVFPIIMTVSFVKGSSVWGVMLLLAYAFGYGLTITTFTVLAGFGLGKVGHTFSKFNKYLKLVSGVIMIILGFYFILTF
ncbi:MAG: cytochrome c biogenesis protein CcdA [Bacteroidales bacterium]|nr:cytochrome c biogenesis protein CcdA [Bacteroidales bacterium]